MSRIKLALGTFLVAAATFALGATSATVAQPLRLVIVSVEVQLPGASAEVVEAEVSVPIERVLSKLGHVRQVMLSSAQGASYGEIQFDGDHSTAPIGRVSQALGRVVLPVDASSPLINQHARLHLF